MTIDYNGALVLDDLRVAEDVIVEFFQYAGLLRLLKEELAIASETVGEAVE